jgi:hypothetical protein
MTDDEFDVALKELVLKGLATVDNEGNYSITEAGKALIPDLIKLDYLPSPSKQVH